MFSIFSNIQKKPSEQICELKKCAGASLIRELVAGPEDEPLYMLKPEVISWLKWINSKILFELPRVSVSSDAQWIGVRVRIAANMLNKLEESKILSKDVCIKYHERLTSRIKGLLGEIYTEDLPF